MATISEALTIAVQHHKSGRLSTAEQIYRQILAVEPNHANAWNLLGVVASQMGEHKVATESIRRAIQIDGTVAAFHRNLGQAFKDQGKFHEAATSYQRALELEPDIAETHNNLGIVLKSQGKLDEAVASYRRALTLKPDYTNAYNNLGNILIIQKKSDDALSAFRKALEINPKIAEAHNNLGNVLKDQGQLDEAIACYRRALELRPEFAEAHNNLGNVYTAQGKLDEAVTCIRRAIELKPNFVEALNSLGNATKNQGNLVEAVSCFRRVLELNPEFADPLIGLGNALNKQGKLTEAASCFRRALEIKPDFPEAHNNLGNVFKDQGNLDEAIVCYRRALELGPDYAWIHSNLLYAMQYQPKVSLSELAVAHAEYNRVHAAPLQVLWQRHENDRDPNRKLRVGFVSPNFSRHPVGWFLIRCLENLDRNQCESVCYNSRAKKDDLTGRFQAAASIWREVVGLNDEQLAQQIRADRIDILFDLAGHLADNRALVFARKPAPIQVKWGGFPGTTGLKAMDYILADRHQIPTEAEVYYCEKVLRMPDGYVCYEPPSYAPLVSPLPALSQGNLTFGSFNNPAKFSSQMVEVWATLLERVPRSRLVLKYRGVNDESIAKRLANEFSSHRIDPQRVECLGHSPHASLLAEYHQIDLALDPYPYNGGLTTCEALWMGVPVVTCPGETFSSRHSLSHLSNVGLMETVARDLNEYVEIAASFASDLPRLAMLRAGLRERMAASPLCDGKRFAANLMTLLLDIWQQWVSSGGNHELNVEPKFPKCEQR